MSVLTFSVFLASVALKFLGIFTASLKMISELQTYGISETVFPPRL